MRKITVRLDRIQILAWEKPDPQPPTVQGFRVTKDSFVRTQTTTQTYARCRQYSSLTSGAKIYWQYSRQKAWLKPWKITMIADDMAGLSRAEIARVLRHCRSYRILTVEIAIDFSPSTGISRHFIQGHAVFGKSHDHA